MQYNTFRKARDIPMATTFCTNHVRQMGIQIAKVIEEKDINNLKRCGVHLIMILCFIAGGIILTFACSYMFERAIWLALIPLLITLYNLIREDVTTYKIARAELLEK